jgi:aldose 1-epimerase
MSKLQIFFFLISIIIFSCKSDSTQSPNLIKEKALSISKSAFGTLDDGQVIDEYILKNGLGMEIKVLSYGGIITYWTAADRNGKYENVVLGFDSLSPYVKDNPYFGALIGRFGNRIAKGKFSLNGKPYQLATNNGPNHLHGGLKGFDKVIWTAVPIQKDSSVSLVLSYESKDMEEGYPGNLNVKVTYTLTNQDALEISYEATTDQSTIINLTQHSYFNLSADFTQKITNHILQINGDRYLPVDPTLIPTGELAPVDNTPFDFRDPKPIGKDINGDNEQLKRGRGFDHCWVLNNPGKMQIAASLFHPMSGRFLEVVSDQPGVQFYTGNFLDGTLSRPDGGTYDHRTGLCLETQHFPDSPNQENFPRVVLNPDEIYLTKTIFKFSTN